MFFETKNISKELLGSFTNLPIVNNHAHTINGYIQWLMLDTVKEQISINFR